VPEAGGLAKGEGHPVADGQGVNLGLPVFPNVQHGASFGRGEPLVRVRGRVGCAQVVEGQRHHADAVRGVEQHRHAAGFQGLDEGFEGHPQPGRAGHGVDHRQNRALAHAGHDAFHHDLGPVDGKGQVHRDHGRAPTVGDVIDGVPAGLVGVVGHEDLVARLKAKRAQHGVDP